MKSVTVVLPEDLARQAQAAGLFADRRLEELIRQALQEQIAVKSTEHTNTQHRRLVRQNGHLVVEALPGEQPMTAARIRELLEKMEW